jgi:hypothetical protein
MPRIKIGRIGKRKKSGLPALYENLVKNKIEVLAVILIIVIISISFSLSYPGQTDSVTEAGGEEKAAGTEALPQDVQDCLDRNPNMLEDQCWDMKYRNDAIKNKDPTLCDKIKGENVREHCKRYFE